MLYIEDKEYKRIVKQVLNNSNFKKLCNITHHGISRYEHLVKVSYKSYSIAKKLKLDYKNVAIGAILHDFYLDGNERSKKRKFIDTFIHPKKVIKTSMDNFSLTDKEKNIILSHMFPIYPVFPRYIESILVNIVDKIVGSKEMAHEYFYKFRYSINYSLILLLLFVFKD